MREKRSRRQYLCRLSLNRQASWPTCGVQRTRLAEARPRTYDGTFAFRQKKGPFYWTEWHRFNYAIQFSKMGLKTRGRAVGSSAGPRAAWVRFPAPPSPPSPWTIAVPELGGPFWPAQFCNRTGPRDLVVRAALGIEPRPPVARPWI